jgi:hypothetical protein
MQGALARVQGASQVEQALIRALPERYPQRDPIEDQSSWDAAYANAMRQVRCWRARSTSSPLRGTTRGSSTRTST